MYATPSGSAPVTIPLVGICVVFLIGVLAGLLLPSTTTATIVAGAAVIWVALGKFVGGWRAVVWGLVALFAAFVASYGPHEFSAYPLALIFTAAACIVALVGADERHTGSPSR